MQLLGPGHASGSRARNELTDALQFFGRLELHVCFRRELSCVLDVSFVAAQRFPCRRVTNLDGASEQVFTTDASPSGAGACSAPLSRDDWLQLDDLCEEKDEHVRLDMDETAPSSLPPWANPGDAPPRNRTVESWRRHLPRDIRVLRAWSRSPSMQPARHHASSQQTLTAMRYPLSIS